MAKSRKRKPKEPLIIWDDAQLFEYLSKHRGLPKDRPVMIFRRMYDIPATQNNVLDMLAEEYPNVVAVCCTLNPRTDRIAVKRKPADE